MIVFQRTDSSSPDFIGLVAQLDADLAERDGEDHAFYHEFNSIDTLGHVVLAYDGEEAIGCGAIKPIGKDAMEVKRMFVPMHRRGRGIAGGLLNELEKWASEVGRHRCLLETGQRQPEAIHLYEKKGYRRIPNYGQYVGVDNSLCYEKRLNEGSLNVDLSTPRS